LHWFVPRVAHWFSHDIVAGGRLPLLCCLVAFILTFFVTRTFVRFIRHRVAAGSPARWWQPRNVHIGGLHIHHVTFGVVLVMISGLTLVTLSVNGQEPENTLVSIFFGIGAALVLDEYALILHLSDVYWEEDGRSSVDAVFAAVAVAGLLIMGLHPLMFFFPFAHGTDSFAWHAAVLGAQLATRRERALGIRIERLDLCGGQRADAPAGVVEIEGPVAQGVQRNRPLFKDRANGL